MLLVAIAYLFMVDTSAITLSKKTAGLTYSSINQDESSLVNINKYGGNINWPISKSNVIVIKAHQTRYRNPFAKKNLGVTEPNIEIGLRQLSEPSKYIQTYIYTGLGFSSTNYYSQKIKNMFSAHVSTGLEYEVSNLTNILTSSEIAYINKNLLLKLKLKASYLLSSKITLEPELQRDISSKLTTIKIGLKRLF